MEKMEALEAQWVELVSGSEAELETAVQVRVAEAALVMAEVVRVAVMAQVGPVERVVVATDRRR